jgi:RHS repeat-associated protein
MDTSSGTHLADFALFLQESMLYGSSRLGLVNINSYAEPPSPRGSYYDYFRGYKFYEISNHLGNVVTVIDDKKLGVIDSSISTTRYAYYNPEIVDATDYWSFGMVRLNYNAGIYAYRYGFNGKEKDNDVKGEGDQMDYGNRIYDPRVGRFLSVDPLTPKYPGLSSYQYASNSPMQNIDLDGLEGTHFWQRFWDMPVQTVMGMSWDDANDAVDGFNKTLNPLGIVVHGTYSTVTGKDLTYGTPRDRTTAFTDMGVNTLMFYTGEELFSGYATESKLENEMLFNRNAANLKPTPGKGIPTAGGASNTINGTWVRESIAGWSQKAISYQEFVTGVKAGNALEVNGVRFDGIRNNTLIEAKSSYNNFINKKTGQFYNWFLNSKTGAKSLLDQAQRQIKAANGAGIEWNFSKKETLDATQKLFKDNHITGINLKYNPQP